MNGFPLAAFSMTHEVYWTEPGVAHAWPHGGGITHTPVVDPKFPPVEPAHILAEKLACSVERLGTLQRKVVDGIVREIEPERRDATGEDDFFHAQKASGLEDMKGAHRIGVEGGCGILLRRQRQHRAQVVDDLGSTRSRCLENLAEVPDVALHEGDRVAEVRSLRRESLTSNSVTSVVPRPTSRPAQTSAPMKPVPPVINVPVLLAIFGSSIINRLRRLQRHRRFPRIGVIPSRVQIEHPTTQLIHVVSDRE